MPESFDFEIFKFNVNQALVSHFNAGIFPRVKHCNTSFSEVKLMDRVFLSNIKGLKLVLLYIIPVPTS